MCELRHGAAAEQKDPTSYSADEMLSTRQNYSAYNAALRSPAVLVAKAGAGADPLISHGPSVRASRKSPDLGPPDLSSPESRPPRWEQNVHLMTEASVYSEPPPRPLSVLHSAARLIPGLFLRV